VHDKSILVANIDGLSVENKNRRIMNFTKVLEKYRKISFSQRDKGDRFERLIKSFLQTDPKYTTLFKKIWLWNEFPGRKDLGGVDSGIDLVALTYDGLYWAIQCKCFIESSTIDKAAVDTLYCSKGNKEIFSNNS